MDLVFYGFFFPEGNETVLLHMTAIISSMLHVSTFAVNLAKLVFSFRALERN